jgi:glycosyltransferase involved in cell wall biosynthesis
MMISAEQSTIRVAWLFPSLARGFYWHPVLAELAKVFPEMITFTGHWTGYSPNYEGAFRVRVVGTFKFFLIKKSSSGYDRAIILPSLKIVPNLAHFKPNVIMTAAFSFWTFIAVLLKPLYKWKIVIVFDGISPSLGGEKSKAHKLWRNIIAAFTDAFITNSQSGKDYLVEQLGIDTYKVFSKPYEVPDHLSFFGKDIKKPSPFPWEHTGRQVFLSVGQLITRKGISFLLDACLLLKEKGYTSWSLVIVGDGPLRAHLQDYTRSIGLEDSVHWQGWIDNASLGIYFQSVDVFVFPTLEDIWGVTVLEAMLFDKPILCSKEAGASELIKEGENGFTFDPTHPERLAELMKILIDRPELVRSMGERSGQLMRPFTPKNTANHLASVIETVLSINGYKSVISNDKDSFTQAI